MDEALENDPFKYESFNAFFTRKLKPGARPIIADNNQIASPVDGKVWQSGQADKGLIHAKGKDFTVDQLIPDQDTSHEFQNANFSVLYLAPYNYHRIHMPITGKLLTTYYVPGTLFSVNPRIVEHMPDIFARNERVVAIFSTDIGNIAIILVGAFFVGSIATSWAGIIAPGKQKIVTKWEHKHDKIAYKLGEEIGQFRLGSTVVMLLPSAYSQWKTNLAPGTSVMMGQNIGTIKA